VRILSLGSAREGQLIFGSWSSHLGWGTVGSDPGGLIVKDAHAPVVRADMSAFEFCEAAWAAAEGREPAPDAASLSDRALLIAMRYEERDLPSGSHRALAAECRRRGSIHATAGAWLGPAAVFLVGQGWLLIAWVLLG
jgi:hypothetical protein